MSKTVLWWTPVVIFAVIAGILESGGIGLDMWQFWAIMGLLILMRSADAVRSGERW